MLPLKKIGRLKYPRQFSPQIEVKMPRFVISMYIGENLVMTACVRNIRGKGKQCSVTIPRRDSKAERPIEQRTPKVTPTTFTTNNHHASADNHSRLARDTTARQRKL
jgi:hypothetical protein